MFVRSERISSGGVLFVRLFFLFCFIVSVFSSISYGQMTAQDVLVLVNENSPTSKYIAKLYRQYHPDVPALQVLHLSGLTDCSGPASTSADEIITREVFNNSIAQPVRDFLIDNNRTTTVKIIITTAGMPYRIEDTDPAYADAIYPAGSNPNTISGNLSRVDVASVESELTCLWYSDYGQEPFGAENRMVNVYQGYRQSSISVFQRLEPGSKDMEWTSALQALGVPPIMEGETELGFPPVYGTLNRLFNAGDIYLTCRLDGPKQQGRSAVFAVRAMLERAKRASDPALGVSPLQAVAVLDDAPNASSNYDRNRIYNLDGSVNYIVCDPCVNQPPDADTILLRDDYMETFTALANDQANEDVLNTGTMDYGEELLVMLDRRDNTRTSQTDLDDYAVANPDRDEYQGVILLAGFGCNGDEGSTSDYLVTGGPGGGPLFNTVNGAVFTSIESFNAVTMFTDVGPVQGKIVDFITIGGAGAIGHSFEPMAIAVVDNLYLHYNLLADEDADGMADLTFVEAAFTGIPFLSWSEVVIGDPLMQIAYGPGGKVWTYLLGDVNNNGRVNFADIWYLKGKVGGVLNTTDPEKFELYDDLYDVNQDGRINYGDVWLAKGNLGAIADW